MMAHPRISSAKVILLTLVLLPGCRDDRNVSPSVIGTGQTHVAISIDSAFIQTPNVVTPNADGINDVFSISTRNINSMTTVILRLNGDTAFVSDAIAPVWSDLDSTDLGRYRVHVAGWSASGHQLTGSGLLDVILYNSAGCLSYPWTPVTSDQYDPRLFGVSYPSQEVFCE